jgi:hypothetical protein
LKVGKIGSEIKPGIRAHTGNPANEIPGGENRNARPGGEGWRALLQQLEASLGRSHQALVALDLAGIEQGTREQQRLCRNLAEEIWRRKNTEDARAEENPALGEELRRDAGKVLAAARVQAALVKRAQRKLQILANMLAGAERTYTSPMEQKGFALRVTGENRG